MVEARTGRFEAVAEAGGNNTATSTVPDEAARPEGTVHRRRGSTPTAGAPHHYLLHCHNLEHEDMAMMAAFRTS